MPYSYKISEVEKRVLIKLSGQIKLDELSSALKKLNSEPNFDKNFDFLTDARSAEFNVVPQDVDEFAKEFTGVLRGGTGKSALIVNTPNETAFGMLHQAKVSAARTVRIFYTIEAATDWLNTKKRH